MSLCHSDRYFLIFTTIIKAITATIIHSTNLSVVCSAVPPLCPPPTKGRLLISMESRFSIYTVSTFTSVFVLCTAIASRLLPLSLSVTVETLSVSPISLRSTVMVVTSMIVSCTATITSFFTESVCSYVATLSRLLLTVL